MIRILAALVMLVALATPAMAQSRFDGWATAVIAADWRTSRGQPIQAFDNARRDLVSGFVAAGFSRADMVDYSLRPDVADPVTATQALAGVGSLTARATAGCLLYFTSHGSPQGMVFGPNRMLAPGDMANLVRGWCGTRPTVIVVSACFSGVFVEGLKGPNRMIMTAARRDRSSFGCSEDATYPYFDGCIIESLPTATDFADLAHAAGACVSRREREEGLTPSSEPQVWIGPAMQLRMPTLRFDHAAD
ncbi:C13 family peptidase [Brevundimonas sp.]|uniref:C13 family peptidase n=1 Tax=Brevundimonas sp. TaxID=1871086 RepID=UPI002ABCBD37|nr:C13 family peptidase [Brevundimonas sp.]MDZ4365119.1 C13 family peptidase [Brevundimonas sp.]